MAWLVLAVGLAFEFYFFRWLFKKYPKANVPEQGMEAFWNAVEVAQYEISGEDVCPVFKHELHDVAVTTAEIASSDVGVDFGNFGL